MAFKKVLFGYSRSEVDDHIKRLKEDLSQRDTEIDRLKRENYKLECAKDELQVRISILEALRKDLLSRQ